MAGGLFGRPFAANPKCVAFSLIVIALFIANPSGLGGIGKVVSCVALFVIAYVGMAWYDYYFDCQAVPLERGKGPTSALKPPAPAQQQKPDARKQRTIIYALHLLIIAPILGFVAWRGRKAPKGTWLLLGVLAVMTAAYHGAKLVSL